VFPKRLTPLTIDPTAGVDVPPEAAPAAVVAAGVVPDAGVVGLVLAHPAIAMAITTRMIAKILVREMFMLFLQI